MNIITPKMGQIDVRKKTANNPAQKSNFSNQVSFKAGPKELMSIADEQVLKLFSKHYDNAGNYLINKADELIKESKVLEKTSRYLVENGKLAVKDKGFCRSFVESIFFPFAKLPFYGANWVVKKGKSVPSISKAAETLYQKPILRNPRKINQLNDLMNQSKGVMDKTRSIVEDFLIKEKGRNIAPDKIAEETDKLIKKMGNDSKDKLAKEANEYLKENLYKVSNKFFDKKTGNFNTALERPLNRIVTGLIPVAFLANDAYNLSVLCGDKKEDSKKEANERIEQEFTRVLSTAYLQSVVFGTFTKQVNNISWFTPLTSAVITVFTEIFSRAKTGKPILFISKSKSKEYNKKEAEKANNKSPKVEKQEIAVKTAEKTENAKTPVINTPVAKQRKEDQYTNLIFANSASSKIFESFKAGETSTAQKTKETEKDPQEKKALINMKTFKKGLLILLAGGFALSLLKNSSLTKNSKFMQKCNDIKKVFSDLYEKLTTKTFEIKTSEFDDIMNVLDEIDCKEIANGHRFIKNKYAEKGANIADVIRMETHKLSGEEKKKTIEQISNSLKKLKGVSENDAKAILESVNTAISKEGASISEMKYDKVAKKATEIIKNKNINISDKDVKSLSKTITDAVTDNSAGDFVKIDRKIKPFIDIVIEPFRFVLRIAKKPISLVESIARASTSKINEKAEKEALGLDKLNKFERGINKAVKEVFGEKSEKAGKISQAIFANSMEQLQKKTASYTKAKKALDAAKANGTVDAKVQVKFDKAKEKLYKYINKSVQKSFDGVTQSNNKNTDVAMMTKLVSSLVTSVFLVSDNYNMVMIKSKGEDVEGAKEKANERIIQRLSALFYQALFINWFNTTFQSLYNSSLPGMSFVSTLSTFTTEILTRKSIGMPLGRKSYEQLVENEEKNENRKGFLGKYFKFMRLLTGKKPLKDRMPKNKEIVVAANTAAVQQIKNQSTNLLERYTKQNFL